MKRWRSDRSTVQSYSGAFLVFVTVLCAGALPALGAELQLRETLLQAQRDRVTATITAVVDHVGTSAHPISDDCDLHVPLRSREINIPFIGEVKNACSEIPPGASQAHWSDRIYEETHGRAVTVTGAFRIWLEHPPAGTAVQTEADPPGHSDVYRLRPPAAHDRDQEEAHRPAAPGRRRRLRSPGGHQDGEQPLGPPRARRGGTGIAC